MCAVDVPQSMRRLGGNVIAVWAFVFDVKMHRFDVLFAVGSIRVRCLVVEYSVTVVGVGTLDALAGQSSNPFVENDCFGVILIHFKVFARFFWFLLQLLCVC